MSGRRKFLTTVLGLACLPFTRLASKEKPTIVGKRFEGVDFTDRPHAIYRHCEFIGCGGLLIASDEHPGWSEIYNVRCEGLASAGHMCFASTWRLPRVHSPEESTLRGSIRELTPGERAKLRRTLS